MGSFFTKFEGGEFLVENENPWNVWNLVDVPFLSHKQTAKSWQLSTPIAKHHEHVIWTFYIK
jgi:hypothetical protein